MGLLNGKKGIVMGIANDRSIASGIAKQLFEEGASIGYSYLPDTGERARNLQRIEQVTKDLDPAFIFPCDVTSDEDIQAFFDKAKESMGSIDFLIHSIAFAPTEDIKRPASSASRQGFQTAMDISVYSFMKVADTAKELMEQGGSICSMTYFGGEKVMPGYNLMGICKAALDSATKYAAYDLGSRGIRVNTISAGPVKTLAASAVGDFKTMLSTYESISPLGKNISSGDVGKTTAFLLSDYASMITGETIHVDAGFHVMGAVPQGQ